MKLELANLEDTSTHWLKVPILRFIFSTDQFVTLYRQFAAPLGGGGLRIVSLAFMGLGRALIE